MFFFSIPGIVAAVRGVSVTLCVAVCPALQIRWLQALSFFMNLLGVLAYTFLIFQNFCVPTFADTGRNPGDVKTFVMCVLAMLGFFCRACCRVARRFPVCPARGVRWPRCPG